MKVMRIRSLLPALLIGAGMLLPIQTPALAKSHNVSHKVKKMKRSKKYKVQKRKIRPQKIRPQKIHH